MGDTAGVVTLRPVGRDEVALLDAWRHDPEHGSEYGDFLALQRPRSVNAENWERDGLLGEDDGRMLVCVDGQPVGAVQWFPTRYGPNRGSQALCLGISIEPALRGRGIGARAQRLLAEYLFAQTLTNRVEATTDVANVREQKALERAGFTREGVLRGAQFRRGEWHDMVQYAKLRHDL